MAFIDLHFNSIVKFPDAFSILALILSRSGVKLCSKIARGDAKDWQTDSIVRPSNDLLLRCTATRKTLTLLTFSFSCWLISCLHLAISLFILRLLLHPLSLAVVSFFACSPAFNLRNSIKTHENELGFGRTLFLKMLFLLIKINWLVIRF